MKHNLLKSVIISVILLMGVSNAWGKTFYLKPNSDWKSSSAKFAICYGYDNSSDQNFVEMTVVSGTDWYSADVPSSASSKNIYFMRVSSTWKVSDKWSNKWNGFGWFSYSDGSHYVTDDWNAGSKLNAGFEGGNNGIKYWKSGDANDTEWSFNGNIAQDKNLNEVTHLNLKQWFTQMYENKDFWNVKTVFKYSIHLASSSPSSYQLSNHNWETKGNWSNGYCYPKIGNNNIDINLLQNLNGSGKYTMSFYYYDPDLNITSPTHKLNWTYNIVPNVNNLKVTANNRVSGSGTSNDPYIITCGQSMTLTVSGEKASTDANSSLNVSFGDNSAYSSTLTKTYSSIPTGKQSVKVYAKFYNSSDDLSGTETETTIYYQAQTFSVNITSAGNGTVTPNGNTLVGANKVNISATPNDGYKFKNWTQTGNVTIADANNASTTITATGAGSVTANFEKQNRIYLKPAGDNDWANGTNDGTPPRYAVYVIDDQTWHNMTKINDGDGNIGNDIYYCDIESTYQEVIFCRMDPKAADNNWGNRWTQTEDLTLPDNCNLFDIAKDASTENNVNATGTWMEYNAWHLACSFNEWALCGQTFKEQGNGSFTFTQHLEAGNTYEFKLVHNGEWYGNNGTMVRGTSTGWDMETSKDKCKITADYTGDYTFTFDVSVSTKKLTVRYPILITLGYCDFGTYGIKYNGQSYFSKPNENVTINVPAGAQIEILEGQPLSNAYTGDVIQAKPTSATLSSGQKLTVNGDIMLADNFVTKKSHVVYLGVPNSVATWNSTEIQNNTRKFYVWRTKTGHQYDIDATNDAGKYVFEINNIKYYQFTIAAGCNDFRFEQKDATPDNDTYSKTVWFPFQIPLTDVNCFTLDGNYTTSNGHNYYTGSWNVLPAQVGDYRLLYVEQVVEKGTDADSWKTVIRRTYEHPSDVVKKSATTGKRDVVSLHIFTKHENPEVILQQYQTVESKNQWVDIEAHMVNGPLETVPGMAMLPGRKNAGEGSGCDDFIYDDGIEIIKTDDTDAGCGVWDFTIVQNGKTATLDLTEAGLTRYEGDYYIRTSSAPGQWSNYKISENELTESNYATENFKLNNPEFVENEYFTHYFCKYVDKAKTKNVKFVVANDNGMAISKVFTQDAFTDADGNLQGENANVRFAWNQITNTCKRAYIAGSFERGNEFLVVRKNGEDPKVTIQNNNNNQPGYFNDNTNWLYYADVLAQSGAKAQVVAKYNGKYQYFMGAESGADQYEQLIGGTDNSTNYPIRIMYEFPEHRFVVAYMPPSTITGDVAIETPIMLIRENHGEANQITFSDNEKKIIAPLPAYGTITFTEGHLKDNTKSQYEKALYWISFPFEVNISNAFGFGKYGEDWVIEYYDGEERSKIGLNSYNSFWKYNWKEDFVMEAGKGYVLCLDVNKVITHFLDGNNENEKISLYFPSTESIAWGNIKSQGPFSVKINEWKTNKTKETDHNWNLIGVVSYANTGESTQQGNTNFLYEYVSATDTYTPRTSNGYEFKALHAYMVQYAGDIKWTSHIAPKAIAAKENATSEDEIHRLSLDLIYNDKTLDQTFFQLEDGEATQMFDLNIDMTKIINSGANIYSISSDNNQLAGNVLPIQETVIPVGVVISAAGEYTFAMPEGTDGIVVELIDYENNTRTNMMLDNYTVNLGKGTNETRFALHVKPDKTSTSVVNIGNEATGDKVKKYLIDGVLYMQKDGALYDAQGRKL